MDYDELNVSDLLLPLCFCKPVFSHEAISNKKKFVLGQSRWCLTCKVKPFCHPFVFYKSWKSEMPQKCLTEFTQSMKLQGMLTWSQKYININFILAKKLNVSLHLHWTTQCQVLYPDRYSVVPFYLESATIKLLFTWPAWCLNYTWNGGGIEITPLTLANNYYSEIKSSFFYDFPPVWIHSRQSCKGWGCKLVKLLVKIHIDRRYQTDIGSTSAILLGEYSVPMLAQCNFVHWANVGPPGLTDFNQPYILVNVGPGLGQRWLSSL